MSGPFFFGLGPGHLGGRARKIAEKHDADLVNYTEPNGQRRHWVSCQNMGEPFNSATAKAVLSDLERAGILGPD